MIEILINFLQVNILPLGGIGVFIASVVEEVVAPIPSAVIMTMSGFLFVQGPLSWQAISALIFKVALPASLGVTLGSYGIYFIARFGGKFVIEKWGKYIGLYWSDIEKMQSRLVGTRKDEVLIGVARVIPIVPSVAISAFCGVMQMNVVSYFVVSFIGVFVRGLILGILGWQVGNLYQKYADVFSKIESTILLSTIFVIIIFVVLKYRSRKDS